MFCFSISCRPRRVFGVGLLLAILTITRSMGEIPPPAKRPVGTVSTTAVGGSAMPVPPAHLAVSQRMESDLDAALLPLNQRLDTRSVIVPDAMTNLPVTVSEQAADERGTARRLMSYLDQNPERTKALVELRFEDLMVLPIGLTQTIGDGSKLTVGILEAQFFKDHAELTVFVRMQTTLDNPQPGEKGRDLFFGVDKLRFTKEGGLSGESFRAILLGDYVLPMHNWTVILRGGMGRADRDYAGSKTFVEVACNSFKSASLAAQIVFPRSVLVPFNETTRTPVAAPARVAIDFAVETTEGFRNILVGINASQAFAVAGFERFGFKLKNLIIDLSDTKNGMMVFPPTYEGDRDERWRGLFLQEFTVLLPTEFQRSDGSKISLGGRSVLIDRSGFSGVVSYANETNPELCDASRWKLTLKSFDLEFVQNTPTRGRFAGGIETPLTSAPFSYTAIIDPTTGLYAVGVRAEGDVPIKCWRANGKIYAGSQVELVVKDGRFLPSARLSGELTIGTRVATTVQEGDPVDTENGTASFKQIQFTDLFLQTVRPYVTLGDFRYSDKGTNTLAGFPVAIVKLQKSAETPADGNSLWIDFGFRVSLAEDRFAGSSNLIIKSAYDEDTGKLRFRGIAVRSIYVRGSTTAVDLEGSLEIYDLPDVKGFRGSLTVAIKKPFVVGVVANATFGYQKIERFRYGYVDIYASKGDVKAVGQSAPTKAGVPGIPIGFGNLYINGLGLGLYFNMKPQFLSSPVASAGCFAPAGGVFAYCPNRQIPFGFKAMVGLVNGGESFQGRFALEFALDRQYGLNSIALSGNGVFGQKPENPKNPPSGDGDRAYAREALGKNLTGQSDDQLANIREAHTQQETQEQARQKNIRQYGSVSGVAREGDIAFAAGFLYSMPERMLHAEAEIYINRGKLVGIGPGGLAARGVLHFDPGKFYIHLGYPLPFNRRMGIRYGDNVVLSAYLMAGAGVPKFPPPPPAVVSYFPSLRSGLSNNSAAVSSRIGEGTAFALGASTDININVDGWLGYVYGRAIAGADLLITNGSGCKPGKWWGQGQLYGIIEGRGGVYIFGRRKNLFSGTAGLYLYANAFNPTGFSGELCVSISRRKKLCFDVNIGDICRN